MSTRNKERGLFVLLYPLSQIFFVGLFKVPAVRQFFFKKVPEKTGANLVEAATQVGALLIELHWVVAALIERDDVFDLHAENENILSTHFFIHFNICAVFHIGFEKCKNVEKVSALRFI